MSRRVHIRIHIGRVPKPACRADRNAPSTVIATSNNWEDVTCDNCHRMRKNMEAKP